jgi:hypothetical protein
VLIADGNRHWSSAIPICLITDDDLESLAPKNTNHRHAVQNRIAATIRGQPDEAATIHMVAIEAQRIHLTTLL